MHVLTGRGLWLPRWHRSIEVLSPAVVTSEGHTFAVIIVEITLADLREVLLLHHGVISHVRDHTLILQLAVFMPILDEKAREGCFVAAFAPRAPSYNIAGNLHWWPVPLRRFERSLTRIKLMKIESRQLNLR